jgi:hypothetical protein
MCRIANAPHVALVKVACAICAVSLAITGAVPLMSTALGVTLDDVRNEVRQGPPPEEKKPTANNQHGSCHDDDDSFLGIVINDIARIVWSSCWHRSDICYHYDEKTSQWLSTNEDVTLATLPAEPDMYFTRYPYADGWRGYMMHESWVPARPRTLTGRVSLEYGSDFDDIGRWGLKALVENYGGWGAEFDWNLYVEQLAAGGTDSLHVGDINLLYRLLEAPRMQGRLGIGGNWLSDSRETALGFNSTVKVDIYPRRPLIISGEIDYGRLGGAEMFHGNVTVGAIWDRVEFFGGYDYRKIGSVKLEGPLIGLRLWF